MKKAILAAVCFMLVSLLVVNGTFALPDLNEVFTDLTEQLGAAFSKPEAGGEGKALHVSLHSTSPSQLLYPGGSTSRTSHVKNEGTSNAYFRIAYAVQYNSDSWDLLDIDFQADSSYAVTDDWYSITIGGVPYRMKVVTYNGTLKPNAASPTVTISIGMDKSVTNQMMAKYNENFLQIQALAIDPAPFLEKNYTTPAAALDLALPLDSLNPF